MRQALAKIKNKAVGPTHRYVIGPSDNETYSSRKNNSYGAIETGNKHVHTAVRLVK
jgi:hypothetical protein